MHCGHISIVGCVFWKETARTRKNNSVFRKTVLPHISNTRKGIFLQRRQILLVPNTSKIISERWLLEFFSPRASTLDDVDMSFASAQ
jgi:hypothetical protein